ncbi:acyl transferase/acyl hydrolase/lysophospholipase [Lobosporangium transversale]|uniref:Patatin-like phospholipase domain-containing protein n=1 Tax=Lobosporangium transversale TaxID=64571 RepID=A0A1Y2GFK3_9FUNG|nr:acyl transferase/acyl hydrolase/lysophospholipase [Lobosporangium transversale]ORZ09393.1 acyl transferase/acyl hydrolase/lysophospholipase [Lobosporangium transversale]|eukprot:XP_021878846.1 acyl transferase/acyl hydrolase/lysophospholipase [Lobosporangium transversale]
MATSTVAGSNGKSRMTSHRRGKAKSSPTSNGNGNGNGLIQHDETQETSHSDFSNGSSRASSPIPTQHAHISEFEQTYVNEDHMQQFRQALEDSVRSETSAELISAVTDFMPVQQASSKRARSRKTPRIYKGYSYTLLRIPLMVLIFSIVAVELWIYICVRQIVNLWEYFVTWRGRRNQLRKELRNATTYSDWKAAAQRLDTYMKKDDWKNDPNFGYYDYHLLSRVNRNLRLAREANRVDELKDHLQGVVKSNFGGVENARLYSQTYHGTKKPIEEYVREVTTSLQAVVESKQLTDEEKRVFFKSIHKNYGRTALCLSGGAGFGYYHLGVVRALLQAGVLPTVITGTSAGALMAALVCCHTDEELNEVLVPELAHKFTACADSIFTWLPRLIRKGARFDAEDWARKAQWVTKGGLTFLEAYERTGRILNVSVVPYDPHSPPKLLNYLTAPDCVVWSAVIASAAIPGILNPVVLMRKRPDGKLVPFSYGGRGFKDGSLRADIPLQALHTHFNVNYTIVSQVNPHIHLFFYGSRGSIGRPVSHLYGEGWRGGFLAASIEQFLKLDLSKWLKVLRDLELLPKVMNQDWSWIWLQKFDGHVTILPKSGISDWFNIISDPDEGRLQHCLTVGERQTFPKLHMIANRMRIEQMIAECRSEIKKKLDRKVHGRNLRDAGNSRVLSEDSENTICSRMNSFRDAYSQAGDAYPEGKTRKRRVASWPGLRYALGQESLGDYDALKAKFAHRDEDENVNDIESYVEEKDYEDEDEGMGMEERYD